MLLHSSPFSPFGRKIKIAMALLGQSATIRVADTMNAEDQLRKDNPLGKLPCLVLDDGFAVFDSRVILEYLDGMAGGYKIIPRDKRKRAEALTLQSLADGILDALLLVRYESIFREENMRNQKWLDYQNGKVERTMAALEANPPKWRGNPNVGITAVACALGYQDIRFEGAWRKKYPKLVKWLKDYEKRVPSYEATKPQ
jgi:glutathione S-transferase